MIQRIQTLWLFIATLTMVSLFYFPIYKISGDLLKIGNDFLAIILVVLSMVLSVIALFSYKNRKSQLIFIWMNLLLCIALQIWLFVQIDKFTSLKAHNLDGYFWVGSFIPLITIVFLFLARTGINKDEKLLKSLNRLR